jgi:hypothetical protein
LILQDPLGLRRSAGSSASSRIPQTATTYDSRPQDTRLRRGEDDDIWLRQLEGKRNGVQKKF